MTRLHTTRTIASAPMGAHRAAFVAGRPAGMTTVDAAGPFAAKFGLIPAADQFDRNVPTALASRGAG